MGFNQKALAGRPQKRGFKSKHGTTFGEQEQFHGQDINSFPAGRNMRSVWSFSTQSYKDAHFATYPEELVKRCIMAATPEVGCCSQCGAPWVRIVETKLIPQAHRSNNRKRAGEGEGKTGYLDIMGTNQTQTLGWKPQCQCNAGKVGSVVLDPFAGSSTTLAVAKRMGRRSVGYELSEKYCQLSIKRLEKETAPMRLE